MGAGLSKGYTPGGTPDQIRPPEPSADPQLLYGNDDNLDCPPTTPINDKPPLPVERFLQILAEQGEHIKLSPPELNILLAEMLSANLPQLHGWECIVTTSIVSLGSKYSPGSRIEIDVTLNSPSRLGCSTVRGNFSWFGYYRTPNCLLSATEKNGNGTMFPQSYKDRVIQIGPNHLRIINILSSIPNTVRNIFTHPQSSLTQYLMTRLNDQHPDISYFDFNVRDGILIITVKK